MQFSYISQNTEIFKPRKISVDWRISKRLSELLFKSFNSEKENKATKMQNVNACEKKALLSSENNKRTGNNN